MINFDSKGLLVPNSNILVSLNDFKLHFVDSIPSETRLPNFEKYVKYSSDLKSLLKVDALNQWINGSFVTTLKNPKDIDLVTFIDFELRERFERELIAFEASQANVVYEVDAYIVTVFPKGHSKEFLYKSDRAYWMERFSITRRNVRTGKKYPKGFLEINY